MPWEVGRQPCPGADGEQGLCGPPGLEVPTPEGTLTCGMSFSEHSGWQLLESAQQMPYILMFRTTPTQSPSTISHTGAPSRPAGHPSHTLEDGNSPCAPRPEALRNPPHCSEGGLTRVAQHTLRTPLGVRKQNLLFECEFNIIIVIVFTFLWLLDGQVHCPPSRYS